VKVSFLITFFILLSISKSFSGIDYGLKIGMTVSNQTFEYSEIGSDIDFENRYGYNVEIFIEYPVIKYLFIQPGFYYTQRGMVSEIQGTVIADNEQGYLSKTFTYDNRFDYLGISLSSKFTYKINWIQPYVLTGIRYEFLISKETSDVFDIVYSKYEGNIFGLILGFGTEINNILPVAILLEGVYNYDVTKVEINNNLKIVNSSYKIKFGVKF
jgi:hypothetical protein